MFGICPPTDTTTPYPKKGRQAKRHNKAAIITYLNVLLVVDIQNTLQAQLFKVKTVALVVVRTHSLRVVVDHDGLLAQVAQGTQALHRTDHQTLADAIRIPSAGHYL